MVNRKDFRPYDSKSGGSISSKDKELIKTYAGKGNSDLVKYKSNKGTIEVYSEVVNGERKWFADSVEKNKIVSLGEFDSKAQANGRVKAYNNGTYTC